MKITGTVKGTDGKPYFGAKVFVSDIQGKITPKKIGALSDAEGKFSLDITGKDGTHLSASNIEGNLAITQIKDNITEYFLDFAQGRTYQTPTVTVYGKKIEVEKKPEDVELQKTKNKWVRGLVALGVVLLIAGGYYALRGKK